MTSRGGAETAGARSVVVIRILGGFSVSRDGEQVAETSIANRRARMLLKLLAVERGRHVSTERVIETLWGDEPPQRPADNVAVLVSRLRKVLGVEAISGGRAGYALAAGVRLDLAEAERLVVQAEFRLSSGEFGLAGSAGAAALDLVGTGLVLPGEDAEWTEPAATEAADLLRRARHVVAEAALETDDAATARAAASAAIDTDPLDETAARQLMRACVQLGEPASALAAYEALRAALAEALGVDPATETRDVHLAVLREQRPEATGRERPRRQAAPPPSDTGFFGRDAELEQLTAMWSAASTGAPALAVVVGEAGIGKTRLITELSRIAEATGGVVLSARCYETERSLFLQPVVEALEPAIAAMTAAALRDLAGQRIAVLATLFPQLGELLGPLPHQRGSAENERRQAYDAVSALLSGVSRRQPILLVLDDLQHAGLATIELLHYVARQARNARLLVVAAARAEESSETVQRLSDVGRHIELGPLSREAVARLADRAGLSDATADIMASTRGHTLFVTETLQGLAAGASGVPASLREAILSRVARTGAAAESLLRAAAVLGTTFEPHIVGGLLALPVPEAARRCEQLLATRLVVVSGRDYEFVHDLVHEVLYETTPEPTRLAYHRAAADLLADRPEAVAAHAAACEDWTRAGRALLLAADNAINRYAVADAETLLGRALSAAEQAGDVELQARVHVARGRVREILSSFAEAETDLRAAVELARGAGDPRVEMRALRLLGGDVPVALGQPLASCLPPLHAALRIAESLADRSMEADVLARLAVLAVNQLEFVDGIALGERALSAARASGDDRSLAVALDGVKAGYAYLGDVDRLQPLVTELEQLSRRTGDAFLLHWAVFESAFIPMARAEWALATARIEEALEISERSGWTSYDGWFHAHLGWIARMQGRYDVAVEHGRRSLIERGRPRHAWWDAFGKAMLAATLAETGAMTEAVTLLSEGLDVVERGDAAAYRLRCLAGLARLTGSETQLAEADAMLAAVAVPPGHAWLHGIDVYLAVGAAHLDHGNPQRALEVISPALGAARTTGSIPALAQTSLLQARCVEATGDTTAARAHLETAQQLAQTHGMPYVAREAAALRIGG